MGKKTGCLVAFKVSGRLKAAARTRLFRQLYGWRDKSQYGKYEYQRAGLLGKIGYVPVIRGVFIVKTTDRKKVMKFFKGKAQLFSREIILSARDKNSLRIK